MNKIRLYSTLTLATLALTLGSSSCSKDTPRPRIAVDETQNLGHEVPAFAQLTLEAGTLKPGVTFSSTISLDDVTFSGEPVVTTIANGATVTGPHVHRPGETHEHGEMDPADFEVESIQASPGRVYRLRITYLNASRQPMDEQLISPEQRDRHQHFFRQVLSRDAERRVSYVNVQNRDELLFDYAYLDVIDGQRNPVGLDGLISFVKPAAGRPQMAELNIQLAHFTSRSKFVGNSRNVLPFYSSIIPGSQSDINLPVFFHIDEEHHDHDHDHEH